MLLQILTKIPWVPLQKKTTSILTTVRYRHKFIYPHGYTHMGLPSTYRCDAHANELPIPCGSWDDHYKKRQKFYNTFLLSGFLWWVFSFVIMLWTNSLFLNCAPPHLPSPQLDMNTSCGDEDVVT